MRILIIEDNVELSTLMKANLEKEGYSVDVCACGEEGIRWMRQKAHDIALVDRMLPGMDGVSILRLARKEGITTPAIMITALGGVNQVVAGLDSGADDYIVKPFAMKELFARVRALARRPSAFEAENALKIGDVCLNITSKTLVYKTDSISLSKRESELFEILFKHHKRVVSRAQIFAYVWGADAPVEEANLDIYIHFARNRLREIGAPLKIVTVRGTGYRLEDEHV